MYTIVDLLQKLTHIYKYVYIIDCGLQYNILYKTDDLPGFYLSVMRGEKYVGAAV